MLAGWGNFYVIVGSAAGALTGLMFVVIALTPAQRRRNARYVLHVFATPTIVHLSSVLLFAAVLSMPKHTTESMAATLMAISLGMLFYMRWIISRARRQDVYTPDLEDRVWHFLLPAVAYVGLFAAGITAWWAPGGALYVVGASILLLLFVGIHNAWDSAVWSVLYTPDAEQTE
jgi:hypothetical protein